MIANAGSHKGTICTESEICGPLDHEWDVFTSFPSMSREEEEAGRL